MHASILAAAAAARTRQLHEIARHERESLLVRRGARNRRHNR